MCVLKSDVAQHVVGERSSLEFIQVKVALASGSSVCPCAALSGLTSQLIDKAFVFCLISIVVAYSVQDDQEYACLLDVRRGSSRAYQQSKEAVGQKARKERIGKRNCGSCSASCKKEEDSILDQLGLDQPPFS